MESKNKKMFFSTPEVAKLLKLSRVAIFNKIKAGLIKAEKVGRNYLIPREEIEHFLSGHKKISPSEREEIKKSVQKAIEEYGEAIRMLGKE